MVNKQQEPSCEHKSSRRKASAGRRRKTLSASDRKVDKYLQNNVVAQMKALGRFVANKLTFKMIVLLSDGSRPLLVTRRGSPAWARGRSAAPARTSSSTRFHRHWSPRRRRRRCYDDVPLGWVEKVPGREDGKREMVASLRAATWCSAQRRMLCGMLFSASVVGGKQ